MSLIHVARGGQSLGSFDFKEIATGIASKRFASEDLVWRQGMKDWRPLREMAEVWGLDLSLARTALAAGDVTPSSLVEPAWERRSEIGFFKAFFQTIKEVLFSPSRTFSNIKKTGGFKGPLLFFVIVLSIVKALNVFSSVQFEKDIFILWPSLATHAHHLATAGWLPKLLVSELVLIPGLFLGAACFHLVLRIFKSARAPFEATFRLFCYLGASGVYSIVLFLFVLMGASTGLLSQNIRVYACLAMILVEVGIGVTLFFIGLKKVHRLSSKRTIFLIIASPFLIFLILAVLLLLLGIVLVAIVAGAKHFLH